jgi:hypothetical protein
LFHPHLQRATMRLWCASIALFCFSTGSQDIRNVLPPQVLRHENRSCFEQGRHRRISSPVDETFPGPSIVEELLGRFASIHLTTPKNSYWCLVPV